MRIARFDRFDNYLDDLQDVISAKRTRNVDGTDTIAFTMLGEVTKGDRLVLSSDGGEWYEYIVEQPIVERADTVPVCSFTAKNSIQELELKFIVDKRNDKTKVKVALNKILEGTRWSIGELPEDVVTSENYYHVTAIEALKELCDDTGLEFWTSISIDDKHVISRSLNLGVIGGNKSSGKRFEYGADLTMVRRTISADPVVTRLYGYGKGVASTDDEGNETGGYGRKIDFSDINDGKAYVEDTEATKLWGVPDADGNIAPAEGIIEFPDCEDKEELLELTKAQLKVSCAPQASYECDVQALKVAGYDLTYLHLGESVQILDKAFPGELRLNARVLQIEDSVLTDEVSTITLGNIVQGYTQAQNNVAATVKQLWSSSGAINDAAGLTDSYLDQVVNGLNNVLNATGGYTYFTPGEGIIVYNKPITQNPTKAIQLGGGYFRIANSKNAKGEWNWRTFGTGDGFMADLIVAGKLMSADGHKWFDLDNGNITMENDKGETTLYFDGTAKDNLLTGKVQTSLGEGSDVMTIDPNFTHPNFDPLYVGPTDVVDTYSTGPALTFTPAGTYETQPFIAMDTKDDNENDISALSLYGGTRTPGTTINQGFGAWQRMGMRRNTGNYEGSFWMAMTQADVMHQASDSNRWKWFTYLKMSNTSHMGSYATLSCYGAYSQAGLNMSAGDDQSYYQNHTHLYALSPHSNTGWSGVYSQAYSNVYASLYSRDSNGKVGLDVSITNGTFNAMGRITMTANSRNTFAYYNGSSNWSGSKVVGSTLDFTLSVTPSPSGTYAPVASMDTSSGWYATQVGSTSSASGWHVRAYCLSGSSDTPWLSTLAFLK